MPEARKLTRDEMIALVKRILAADGTEEEIDALVELFDANCLHPKKDELIFWPHGFPHDPTKPEPTVEEIVDAAMTPVTGSIIRL